MNKHLVFAVMLTILLLFVGLVMVPATQGIHHSDRNILYGLVRVPVILGAVWAFYGKSMATVRVIGFSLLLTLVMMGTGVLSIPIASGFDVAKQNLIYTLGRVPFIYAMAILIFGDSKKNGVRSTTWNSK